MQISLNDITKVDKFKTIFYLDNFKKLLSNMNGMYSSYDTPADFINAYLGE